MNLYRWMNDISDDKKLSDLSIPGTHDTMATRATMPSAPPFTETQTLSLWNQMATGIRFLDIRLKYENGALACYHGIVWLGKYFGDVLDTVKSYLDSYPSETIYMRILQENSNTAVPDFLSAVRRYANSLPLNRRYTEGVTNQNPKLELTRGKMVFCIDVQGYSQSAYGDLGIDFNGYSFYKTTSDDLKKGDEKVREVQQNLHIANDRASNSTRAYVVGLTANRAKYVDLNGTPLLIARHVNPRIYDYFIDQNFNYVGIVLADYPGWGLISQIINKNFERLLIVNGVFQIVTALNNSSVLDVYPNYNVALYGNNGGNHQKWEFTSYMGEIHLIRNIAYPNLYLSVNSANNVIAAPRNQLQHWLQWWRMERFQDGYRIIHHDSNYVLDVTASKVANGTNIIVDNRHPLNTQARNQTFFIR